MARAGKSHVAHQKEVAGRWLQVLPVEHARRSTCCCCVLLNTAKTHCTSLPMLAVTVAWRQPTYLLHESDLVYNRQPIILQPILRTHGHTVREEFGGFHPEGMTTPAHTSDRTWNCRCVASFTSQGLKHKALLSLGIHSSSSHMVPADSKVSTHRSETFQGQSLKPCTYEQKPAPD